MAHNPVPAYHFYPAELHIYVDGKVVAVIPRNMYKNLAKELIDQMESKNDQRKL